MSKKVGVLFAILLQHPGLFLLPESPREFTVYVHKTKNTVLAHPSTSTLNLTEDVFPPQ